MADKGNDKKWSELMIDLINAAHVVDEGKTLIAEKDKAKWLKILEKAPPHIRASGMQHWVVEKYVKDELARKGM